MNDHTNNAMNRPTTQSQSQSMAKACTSGQPGHCTGPSHEDIARRAYDIYLKTGRKEGQCTRNWHQAEQSLRDQDHAAGR